MRCDNGRLPESGRIVENVGQARKNKENPS
jgi:hypothetical protein